MKEISKKEASEKYGICVSRSDERRVGKECL